MKVGEKPSALVNSVQKTPRSSGWRAKTIVFVLAATALAIAVLGWSERARLALLPRRYEVRRDSSLALAVFQRRNELRPGLATGFAGRVLDARAAPVADALVCASCANCEASHAPPSACERSGADGAYALSHLTAGGYYLSAVAPGHLPATAFEGDPAFLGPSEMRRGVDLVLQSGGATVAGHVLDATGGPIALAKVRALRLVPPRLSIDLITDESGRFELTLAPGPLQLVAEAEGYAPAAKNVVAPNRDMSLLLTPESSVRGTVVSAVDGEGVAGIEIRALPAQSPGVAIFRTALSDGEGAFSLRGLEPGTYLLVAKGERWQERVTLGVELGLATQVDNVRIELAPAASVSGHIRTSEGEAPCREGFVTLSPTQANGDVSARFQGPPSAAAHGVAQLAMIQADGSIFFPGVAAGPYAVDVRCIGYSFADGPRSLQVGTEPIEDLRWNVIPAVNLTVTVADRSGRAVPGAAFDLGILDPDDRLIANMPLLAGPDGRTKIPGLEPGKYALAARGGESVPLELSRREKDKRVTVVLPAGGTIALAVVTAQEQPVDGVGISVLKLTDDSRTAATPVAVNTQPQGEGRHSIGPLPAGRYVVRVTDEPNPPVEVGREGPCIDVKDGASARARVVLSRAGKIEGQVVDEHGGPVENVWVSAVADAQRSRMEEIALMMAPVRVLTDTEGSFSLTNLAEDAHYLLQVEEPAGAVAQKTGVRPGEHVVLALPSAAAISGEVVAADGKPLQRFTLRATHLESGVARMTSVADEAGKFALSGITPGTVEIAVTSDSGAFVQSTVQLIPGKHLNGLRLAENRGASSAPSSASAPDPTAASEAKSDNGT